MASIRSRKISASIVVLPSSRACPGALSATVGGRFKGEHRGHRNPQVAEKAEVTLAGIIEQLGTTYTNASADKQRSAAVAALVAQAKLVGFWVDRTEAQNTNVVCRDHVSALGPHQPGRYSASSLLARRSACSTAAAKSASTAFLLILRRKRAAPGNSLTGQHPLANPPPPPPPTPSLPNRPPFNCMPS